MARSSSQFKGWRKVGVLSLASGGFTGYFPVASGTFGSLVGLAVFWVFRDVGVPAQIVIAAILFGIGVWASAQAGKIYGVTDSSRIVIDEIAGMFITLIGHPATLHSLVWGFLLFRFLDVVKIPPADYCDARVPGGWGVMLDDVFAGVYANLWLLLIARAAL